MRQHRARKDKAIKRKSEHNMKATKNTTRIVCCPPSKYLTTHNMPFLTGEGGYEVNMCHEKDEGISHV